MNLNDKIFKNGTYQRNLHWKIGEVVPGCTTIAEPFVDGVIAFQKAHGLTEDGLFGRESYKALLADRISHLKEEVAHSDGDRALEAAGKLAVTWGKLLWCKDVVDENSDPRSIALIDAMIRSPVGLDWSWEQPYREDMFQWCGAKAAHDWRETIALLSRRNFWSSTHRLDRWFRYLPFERHQNPPPPAGTPGPLRQIMNLDRRTTSDQVMAFAGTGPRAGDILLIGNAGPGQHICVVDSFDVRSGSFITYEGNGGGFAPNGAKRSDGVVRATRYLGAFLIGSTDQTYIARRLGRPGYHDILKA